MAFTGVARRLRWLAPVAAAGMVAVAAAVPGLSAADSTPSLPPITTSQLIQKAQQADAGALTGTLDLTTNLGIPNLSALTNAGGDGPGGGGFSPTDLASGT